MHSSSAEPQSPSRKRPNTSMNPHPAESPDTAGHSTMKRRRNGSASAQPSQSNSNSNSISQSRSQSAPPQDSDLHSRSSAASRPPVDPPQPQDLQPTQAVLSWYDTLRNVWKHLQHSHPSRTSFKHDEIIAVVDRDFSRFGPTDKRPPKGNRWKQQFSKIIKNPGILIADPSNSESFVLQDINYGKGLKTCANPHHARRRRSDSSLQPASQPSSKTADISRSVSPSNPSHANSTGLKNANPEPTVVDEDLSRAEENALRATIPTEWLAKPSGPVRLSPFDRSKMLVDLSEENAIRGNKGYRTVRATVGVLEGDWYYEAEVLPYGKSEHGAVRPGWTTRRADVETPAGFDLYGFSIRDRTGEFVHCARRQPYGKKFNVGDVIGCRIILPKLTAEEKEAVRKADQKWLEFRFVSLLQGQHPPNNGIDITKRAKVLFYHNGKFLGVPSMFVEARSENTDKQSDRKDSTRVNAVGNTGSKSAEGSGKYNNSKSIIPKREEIGTMVAGIYYPSLSVFGDARIKANFGPKFACGLPEGSKPMSEAAPEQSSGMRLAVQPVISQGESLTLPLRATLAESRPPNTGADQRDAQRLSDNKPLSGRDATTHKSASETAVVKPMENIGPGTSGGRSYNMDHSAATNETTATSSDLDSLPVPGVPPSNK